MTSEPFEFDAGDPPSGVGGSGAPSGAASTNGGPAGTSGAQAGTNGAQAGTSGQAGTSDGRAGTSGAQAGTSGQAGANGGKAGSGGQGGTTGGAAGTSGGQAGSGGRGGSGGGIAPDAGAADAGAVPTFTELYTNLFNNSSYASNCAGGPCHNPGTQKGLDFSTKAKGYSTVLGKISVGNPQSSKLVSVLSSGSMPQARPKMPAADVAKVSAWVKAGALNN